MKFWDASAIVALLIEEEASERVSEIHVADRRVAVWWGTLVECHSALARRERAQALSQSHVQRGRDRLAIYRRAWREVAPAEALREAAVRFAGIHGLKASDALQLAAASELANRVTARFDFVTLDTRLATAAHREGFQILGLP